MQRGGHNFCRKFTGIFCAVCPSGGNGLQGGDIVLKAQAACVDLGGVLRAHIPPVPGLVGDLGGILGPLGVTQDKAILGGVLTQPAERGRVFKTLVQAGVLRAAARPQLCSE